MTNPAKPEITSIKPGRIGVRQKPIIITISTKGFDSGSRVFVEAQAVKQEHDGHGNFFVELPVGLVAQPGEIKVTIHNGSVVSKAYVLKVVYELRTQRRQTTRRMGAGTSKNTRHT